MILPPTKPTTTTTATETINLSSDNNNTNARCSNCGSTNILFLHPMNFRGVDRRVCTSCVLRLNPSYFCPACFEFFNHPLSSTSCASSYRFLSCIKCSSLTHIKCLPSPPPPPSSFLCPPCSRPNFSFFEIERTNRVIDKRLALVLLCAAQIASALMNKALNAAKVKADKCVGYAAVARKRARDALESSAMLEKAKRIERSGQVSGSRNLGKEKAQNVCEKEELDAIKLEGQDKSLLGLPGNGLSVTVHDSPKENGASVSS